MLMSLDDQQAERVIQESARTRSLQEALQLFRNMSHQVGASLSGTVSRVLHMESKRHQALSLEDAAVHTELRAALVDQEAAARRARLAFKEQVSREKEKARVKRELQEATQKLKKIRKEQREAEAVVAAMEQMRVYSLDMLGQGNKKGGTQAHQKARMQVLQTLRKAADLSPEQTSIWEYFKTEWDSRMAAIHGEDWAQLFAEMVQKVVNDLQEGRKEALSQFMHNETRRVLGDAPALVLPGITRA